LVTATAAKAAFTAGGLLDTLVEFDTSALDSEFLLSLGASN